MKLEAGQDHTLAFVFSFYAFKIATIIGSCFAIYLGYRLFILGVTGQASLAVNSPTWHGQLLNAAPGLFFGLGGIAALVVAIWKGVDVEVPPHGEQSPQSGNLPQGNIGGGGGGRYKR